MKLKTILLLITIICISAFTIAEDGGFVGGDRVTDYENSDEVVGTDNNYEIKWVIINNACVQQEVVGDSKSFFNSQSECHNALPAYQTQLEEPSAALNYQDYPYVYYEIKWDENTIKRCVENYPEFDQDVAEYNYQNVKYYIYSLSDCYRENGGRAYYKTYDNCEEYYSFYDLNNEMIDLGSTQIPKFDWNKINCPNHKQQLDAAEIQKELIKYQSPMEGVKELEIAEEGDYLFYKHGEFKNCLENKYEDSAHNFYILRKNRDQTSSEKYYSSRDACFYLNGGNIIYGSSCVKFYTFDVKETSKLAKVECDALPVTQAKVYAEKPTSQNLESDIKQTETVEVAEKQATETSESETKEAESKNEESTEQVETASKSELFNYLPGKTDNEKFMWFAGIAILLFIIISRN